MLEEIKSIICDYIDINPDEIKPESELRKDIGMSSLDLINLAVEVEDCFGVTVSNEDISAIATVSELITFIELKKQ
ncbi:MAG: acyl carrier protein [Clostridia bacterium]|nr:acyl carrier protein [Clostridia bacterium]